MHTLKTYSKNTLIGFLALVFFSNITFAHSVDFHLCQGKFQSVAFFGQKASCTKMMNAKLDESRSCCDTKSDHKGLVVDQKSCCDNFQICQDNILDKPSIDLDQTSLFSADFINDFQKVTFDLDRILLTQNKVEIPPPPNLFYQHSQEKLQVFLI